MQRSWRSVLILPFLLFLAAAAAGQSFILSGRVVTETGEPVPRATVELTESRGGYGMALRWLDGQAHPETIAHTATGEDGWYWLEVPQEGLWRVVARAPGYVPMERFLEPYIGDERLATVALARDAGLPVTVVNADGRPVPRARVWNQPVPGEDRWQGARRSGWSPAFATLLTDDQGRLSLQRAAGESLRVKAWSWGLLASEEVTSEGEPVRLVLSRGVERPVEVVDTRGRPVSAAVLRWGLGWTAGITDEDGRAVLTFPATGATAVSASTQDGRWVSTEVVQPPPEGSAPRVRLELPEPTVVRGRVVDAETGEPVPGALIFRYRIPPAVATGANGSYELRFAVGAGSDPAVRMTAAAPGYRLGNTRVDLTEREPTGHFTLERSRPLSGRVVGPDAAPIAGAQVWRVSQPQWHFIQGGLYRLAREAIETDSRGGFLFVDAPRDEHVLVASRAEGYAPASVSIGPGQSAEDLVLELTTGSSLTGRVVGASGAPVAGARVALTAEPTAVKMPAIPATSALDVTADFEVFAGEEGVFRATLLPAGRFTITVTAGGYAPRLLRSVEIPEAGELDVGEVALKVGAAITGRVVDEHGRPLGGARVGLTAAEEARGITATLLRDPPGPRADERVTGQDGTFRFDDLSTGDRFVVHASAPERTADVAFDVAAPPEEPVELRLEPGARLFGQVVDGDGAPRARQLVRLTVGPRPYPSDHVSTDETGRFEFTGLAEGAYRLYLDYKMEDPGHGPFEVPAGGEVGPLRLVLEPGPVLEGRVLRPDGTPAGGAQVAFEIDSVGRNLRHAQPVEADGTFRLEVPLEGTGRVIATHPEHGRAEAPVELRPGVEPVELVLEPTARIAGRVIAPGDTAVADAEVHLRSVGETGMSTSTRARSDGSFAFTPGPGEYRLMATAPGWVVVEHPEVLTLAESRSIEGIVLELGRGARIEGRITGLEPDDLAKVRVMGMSRGSGPVTNPAATVDYQGRYRLEGITPGRWHVVASLSAPKRQASGEVSLAVGQERAELDLEFTDGYTLSGLVRSWGEPVHGSVRLQGGGTTLGEMTDGRGGFRFAGLPAGEYQLSVYLDPGYYETRELTLVTDEELVLDLRPARVTGRLISPGGEPVAGGQVLLVQEGLEAARRATPQATTGPDGSFEMPGIAEGAYRLSAHHGGASVVRSVQVAGRETDLGEIWLSAGRELTLLPRLSGGGAPQRLAVLFLDAGDRLLVPVEAAVGPDGLAHVRGVPEDAHTAVVMAQELSPEAVAQLPVPGSLPPEAPPIPVVLEQMGTLSIHLPEDVDGATLTLVDAAGRPPLMLRLSGVTSVPLGREHQELPVEPGTWMLTATASDGRAWSAQARVTPAQTTEVRLGTP